MENADVERKVIDSLAIRQGKYEFFLCRIRGDLLCRMAHADQIRLDELSKKRYVGIQRPLDEDRVQKLVRFLESDEAVLPGTVAVNVSSEFIENVSESDGITKLELIVTKDSASIIDGQHRVAALRRTASSKYDVPVVMFIDLEQHEQAFLFNRINANQKPVNPSLSYELFGLSKYRSPQKTAHDVASILNTGERSPFYGKLKMVAGLKDEWSKGGILTQNTFAHELVKLISRNKVDDELAELSRTKPTPDESLPLRQKFLDEKDADIARLVREYFAVVATTWEVEWNNADRKSVLSKSTGYAAWMRVLGDWLKTDEGKTILGGDYTPFASRIPPLQAKYRTTDHAFVSKNYASSSAGMDVLRDKLLADLGLPARPRRQRKN